jgi:hypothetical protein
MRLKELNVKEQLKASNQVYKSKYAHSEGGQLVVGSVLHEFQHLSKDKETFSSKVVQSLLLSLNSGNPKRYICRRGTYIDYINIHHVHIT